eukprot:1066783-Ditylum_brightwellii.AAC.1
MLQSDKATNIPMVVEQPQIIMTFSAASALNYHDTLASSAQAAILTENNYEYSCCNLTTYWCRAAVRKLQCNCNSSISCKATVTAELAVICSYGSIVSCKAKLQKNVMK